MNLDQLAIRTGTDKSSKIHGYTKWYEQYFESMRHKPLVLWEAGYGGYHYPDRGGLSAKMWREYFTQATIVTTDIHPKTNVPDGVHFEQGEQQSKSFWQRMMIKYGSPDIFVDDASHQNHLSILTFEAVFPLLLPGGIYCLEDLESSWWQAIAIDGTDFKGCADPMDWTKPTAINFLRSLINDVNSKIHGYTPNYPVASVHFYDNIAFIIKK